MTSSPDHAGQGSQQPAPAVTPQPPPPHTVKRTRTGGLWVALALFAIVLLLLLIFILENGQRVSISYFGAHGHLPLGVVLLLAAVLGILLVVIAGSGRILQLRAIAHRHRKIDAKRATGPPPEPAPHAETPPDDKP